MYIWEKLIKEIKGNIVTYEDGASETWNDVCLACIPHEEPKDASDFINHYANIVTKDMLDLLVKYDFPVYYTEALLKKIHNSTVKFRDESVEKLLGVYLEDARPSHYLTLTTYVRNNTPESGEQHA